MHDVLIIGGGLVGSSLACALEPLGVDVGCVEASPVAAPGGPRPPAFDERNLALAAASLEALEALGVLGLLAKAPAAIRHVHVSRRGDFGAVRIRAGDHGRDALGGVVVARELGLALEARLAGLSRLSRYRPARLLDVRSAAGFAEVRIERLDTPGRVETLRTRLLVGADGSDSAVRQGIGIAATTHDYRQTLFVSTIAAAQAPDGRAWERFTDAGPMALLPRPDGHYGAMMSVGSDEAAGVAALDDDAYLQRFSERFGSRAGRLTRVGRRSAYPLRSTVADRLCVGRCVLVGNAAQTLHPIGAQGFNLGLRDALALATLVAEAPSADAGDASVLSRYAGLRTGDRARTIAFSDGLARLTARSGFVPHLARSLGLALLERLPGAKATLAATAMGYRGRVRLPVRGGAASA